MAKKSQPSPVIHWSSAKFPINVIHARASFRLANKNWELLKHFKVYLLQTAHFPGEYIHTFFFFPGGALVTESPLAVLFVDWCELRGPRTTLVPKLPATPAPLGTGSAAAKGSAERSSFDSNSSPVFSPFFLTCPKS